MTLRILRPLAELLNVNGDAENALVLARRAEWAGFDCEVLSEMREPPDAIVIGSGFDGDLPEIAERLRPYRGALEAALDSGTPILAVGLGCELLTVGVTTDAGERVEGLGLIDGEAVPERKVSGDVVVESRFGVLVGYENHARTLRGSGEPLGTVLYGHGNGDGTEGVIHENLIGTRMHGPVLAKNPALADHILDIATEGEYSPGSFRAARVDTLASVARSRVLKRVAFAIAVALGLGGSASAQVAAPPTSVIARVHARSARRRQSVTASDLRVFDRRESRVRSYVRSFPVVFESAEGSVLRDEDGREYLDFFSGAGALNYGHNNPVLRQTLLDYIAANGITHSLDFATVAKRQFLEAVERVLLEPRELDYVVQFTGPTGANAVEAALKIARLATGRTNVVAFTHAFHGVSLGALSATASQTFRQAAGAPLGNVTFAPYHGYLGDDFDSMRYLETTITDRSSGTDLPAAVIVETVQGEGGVNVASIEWLRHLRALCASEGIVLIVDDIQVGCGRTGEFFSFEHAGIEPDIITLSKSISGVGLPMSIVLARPELDVWQPGSHSGTFRGNNLAFACATAALETYWADGALAAEVHRKGEVVRARLAAMGSAGELTVRGRGLINGLASSDVELARRVSSEAFDRGLIVETSGAHDEVLKLLPALTISDEELARGLDIIEESLDAAVTSAS